MEGFIKIHRQLLESSVFASEKRLKIWIWLLCKANYKDRFASIKINGEQVIQIKRGQLLFGRFKAENEIGIDGSTIYKTLRYFETENMINIQSNSHYTIITINKYDIYQSLESDEVTAKEQQSNNKVTTKEQQSNTPNKDNKDNKENNIVNAKAFLSQKIKELYPEPNEFEKAELNKFYSYWTEQNKSGSKVKYQMQNTWDLQKRINRWFDNAEKGFKK